MDDLDATITALQRHWPAAIALRPQTRTSFDQLVEHLAPAFPGVDRADAQRLGLFCRLFAGSVLTQDRLLDGDLHQRDVGIMSMQVASMQFEAYRALHDLFDARSRFWTRFRDYFAAYADAFAIEDSFRRGRAVHEHTESLGLEIAIAKHGIAKTIVAALVEVTGRIELDIPLCASIDAVAVAFQMHDDLEDWRMDLWTRTPSVLLSRLPPSIWDAPHDDAWPRFVTAVGRRIYRQGHARYVLELARDTLRGVDRAALPAMPWTEMIEQMIQRAERMLAALYDAVPVAMEAG